MSLKETVILNFARTLPCSGHGCETVSDIIKESQVPVSFYMAQVLFLP